MSDGPEKIPGDEGEVEPRDGKAPAPMWLVVVCTGLVIWGVLYLATYSGGFRGNVLDEDPVAGSPLAVDDGDVEPMVLGQRMYTTFCASCHGGDGRGMAGLYPPLAGSEWVVGQPARLKRILLQGPHGTFTVAGVRYRNDSMPAFGPQLTDRRLAAVATYIRRSWGNSAEAILLESVTATRRATEGRREPWSAEELGAIGADDYVPATTRAARVPLSSRQWLAPRTQLGSRTDETSVAPGPHPRPLPEYRERESAFCLVEARP